MATATLRVYERIPGKDDEHGAGGKYAFVELEASNVAEFEKLRAEAAKSPAFVRYDFEGTMGRKIDARQEVVKEAVQAAQKKTHTLTPAQKAKLVGKKETEDSEPAGVAEAEEKSSEEGADENPEAVAAAESQPESAEPARATVPSAPSTWEKLSPRDIARAKLLARKEGK